MNLSRGKSATPKPPEKGSFPLDHDSECGVLMRQYMQCLKENEFVSRYCRTYSKQYLQCRMNKYVMGAARIIFKNRNIIEYYGALLASINAYYSGLMAPEELSMLGFDGTEDKMTKPLKTTPPK